MQHSPLPSSWLKAYAITSTVSCLGLAMALAVLSSSSSSTQQLTPGGVDSSWPTVGVLTLPSASRQGLDYLPSSYIRWLQSAGVIAIPIPSGVFWNKSTPVWRTQPSYSWTDEQYVHAFDSINAFLLPGGNPWPQVSSPAFQQLYKYAVAANQRGDYFPIWGTCAGFETLLISAQAGCQSHVSDGGIPTDGCAAQGPILRGFDSKNISLPLNFPQQRLKGSLLLADLPASLLAAVSKFNVTFNNHAGGMTAKDFAASNVSDVFHAVSTSKDRGGREFVSMIEARNLPFFGSIFHPEKVLYEWGVDADGSPHQSINHSQVATQLSQYFATFFADQARRNTHKFIGGVDELVGASIYNYQPSAYSQKSPADMQAYYFNWSQTTS